MSGTTSGLITGASRHRIPVTDLDAVAAGHVTHETALRLLRVERSRRMLMLRGVAAQVAAVGDCGPLTPVMDAVDLLLRAERADPQVVAELVAHPAVGVWAVHLLSRLKSPDPPDPRQRPLWQDAGYLHTLAGAAALRAGVAASVRVPARAGTVCLPTLGRAEFPGPHAGHAAAVLDTGASRDDGSATLTLGTRVLRLPEDPWQPDDCWHPVRTLVWHPGGRAHSVVLDDADPYRDFRDLHPEHEPLGAADEERWRRHLAGAGRLLTARHADSAGLVSAVLRTVVPLPRMPRFRTASASHTEAVGSALASLPYDATELAVTLVHEARHSVLNSVVHQVRLFDRPSPDDGTGAEEPLLYAPWRADPRPTPGLLHGAYAFAGVADFWRVERHALRGARADLAHFEFAVWRDAVAEALRSLAAPGPQERLTDWGRRFVTRLTAWTARWERETVPERSFAMARAEANDLRITWRLHHLRPDPDVVRTLADRWRAGDAAGARPASRLRRPPRAGGREPRSELRRILLADGSLAGAEPPPPARRADLVAADVSLVAGDTAAALDGYRAVLADEPGVHGAWAGLALTLEATKRRDAARPLLSHPELVRALALELRERGGPDPDPLALCAWLSD